MLIVAGDLFLAVMAVALCAIVSVVIADAISPEPAEEGQWLLDR